MNKVSESNKRIVQEATYCVQEHVETHLHDDPAIVELNVLIDWIVVEKLEHHHHNVAYLTGGLVGRLLMESLEDLQGAIDKIKKIEDELIRHMCLAAINSRVTLAK